MYQVPDSCQFGQVQVVDDLELGPVYLVHTVNFEVEIIFRTKIIADRLSVIRFLLLCSLARMKTTLAMKKTNV